MHLSCFASSEALLKAVRPVLKRSAPKGPRGRSSIRRMDQSGGLQRGQEIDRVSGCLVLGHLIGLRDGPHDLAHPCPAVEKVPDKGALLVQCENGVQVTGPAADWNNNRFTRDLPGNKIILFR